MAIDELHPFSRLTPDLVLSAAESLGFEADARIFALNSYENRVYQVGLTSGDSIILKFYRPDRWTEDQILEEHHFAQELDLMEIPVIAPQEINNTGTIQNYEGFQIAMFPLFVGRPPALDNLDDLLIMGRFIGRIHAVGSTRNFLHRLQLSIERFAVFSREFLLSNNFIPSDLIEAYDSLSSDIISRLEQRFAEHGELNLLRIHGDCHSGNILCKDDIPHFVDFDDSIMGPAIQDLWMMLSGERDQRQAQLLELIEGYNEFHDFRASELFLIESLRALRIMNYSAWLARRWKDPAFPLSFPWFNTQRYWSEHILELREQLAALDEAPLELIS